MYIYVCIYVSTHIHIEHASPQICSPSKEVNSVAEALLRWIKIAGGAFRLRLSLDCADPQHFTRLMGWIRSVNLGLKAHCPIIPLVKQGYLRVDP